MKSKTNNISANLSNNLRKDYGRKSVGIVKGDSVKIMRGEYKGVEGKVEKIHIHRGRLSIEGVQREKIKGGQVKVQIHASNVQITSLHLDDEKRKKKLQEKKEQINKSSRKSTVNTSNKGVVKDSE
ncbi:50S ribosomal protein L24 [Candidatus Nitrosocosmicus franklandus]|uniref:50S ribosomal protein L24 n=1 Tax=Candidatus Nitrosocosmicus franklandianus TaxID=1798806 RepID=A0A484IF80_9ARCH|nr:50S ribosomal protein L24 [Candidatus Nitrosocosmicus franklandus]VFJ15487.1 50S ribosomal protein L24P [Candidatus Nitrosocosmicus franklandus]